MKNVVTTLKALGDRTRLRIIKLLQHEPVCVCELVRILGMSQSAVSRHLGILKSSGLIDDYRVGKWVFYYLNSDELCTECNEIMQTLLDWLEKDKNLTHQDRQNLVKCIEDRGKGGCPVPDQFVIQQRTSKPEAN